MSAHYPAGVHVSRPVADDDGSAYHVEITRDGDRVCTASAPTKLGAVRRALAEARSLGWCPPLSTEGGVA